MINIIHPSLRLNDFIDSRSIFIFVILPFISLHLKQWANDAIYLSLFIFGYVFAANQNIQEKINKYYKPAVIFGVLSLGMLFYVNIMSQVMYSNEAYLTPLWVLSKGVYECSAIIFLMNFGRSHLNQKSKPLTYLNKSSFTIYIFHFLPVNLFTWLFISLDIPIFVKFLLVVVLSYMTVFLIYELWRRASSLRGRTERKDESF